MSERKTQSHTFLNLKESVKNFQIFEESSSFFLQLLLFMLELKFLKFKKLKTLS